MFSKKFETGDAKPIKQLPRGLPNYLRNAVEYQVEVMLANPSLSFLYVCMVNTIYLLSFVETPRKFIIAELSIRKLGSSSVLIILLALMKIRAYGSKALQ